jgi:hypothetical protein
MSMDSMMGGVMGVAWLPALIALALILGGIVWVVRLLTPERQDGARVRTGELVLGVLAVIGGIALVAVLAMGTMHFGMRCC